MEHIKSVSEEEFKKIVSESSAISDIAERLGYSNKYSSSANKTIKKYIEKYGLDTSHFNYSKRLNFSEEKLREAVQKSKSYAEVARNLGIKESGSFNPVLKALIIKYDLNDSHFTGSLWNKGNYDYSRFTENRLIKNGKTIRLPLIALRGNRCEKCGNTEWLGEKIPLEVHHINGIHIDNRLDNLQLLCPNCHSMTESWKGKNLKKESENYLTDDELVSVLKKSSSIGAALRSLGLSTSDGNYKRAKKLMEEHNIEM